MSNREIINSLEALALFADLRGERFRVRAYRDAVDTIRSHRASLTRLAREGGMPALIALPRVGKGIAKKIVEYAETGGIAELAAEQKHLPIDIVDMTSVEGIGPKQAVLLYEELGATDREGLRAAALDGRLAQVRGFKGSKGARAIRSLKAGIIARSMVVGRIVEPAQKVLDALDVRAGSFAGALRRFDEMVPRAEIVVASDGAENIYDELHSMDSTDRVLEPGVIEHVDGFIVAVTVVPPECFGARLIAATGTQAHWFALQTYAKMKSLELTPDGLFRGERRIAGESESSIYEALRLPFVPAELREGGPEFEAIMKSGLPELVTESDIKGDLQTQTDWSDGRHSIDEMVAKARALGYEYFAITDHTKGLGVAGGLDEGRLAEQGRYIDALDARLDDIRVLKGAEVNILEDGSLDMPDDALAQLDFVGAAIHSHFDLDRAVMTKRIVRAIEHPLVDTYFHPTTRILGRRGPIEMDFDVVVEAAVRTGTALEIDAFAPRLDLSSTLIRRALKGGAQLMLDSDAHRVEQLDWSRALGVPLARRGWAEASDIVNTRPASEFIEWLAARRVSF